MKRRIFLPLGTRMTIPVVLLVAAVAVAAYLGLVRTSRVTALQSKQTAAAMVVKLTARSVMPAVVFADDEEMKRAVSDLGNSPDVTDVELWGTDRENSSAEAPLAAFHRPGGAPIGRPEQTQSKLRLLADSVSVVEPIISPEGSVVGVLAVRFSTAREVRALEALSRQLLYASLGSGAGFTLVLLFVLHRLVLAPIRRLQLWALRLARGDTPPARQAEAEQRIEDEVVRLTRAFYDMAEAVRDREARLGVRNADLKLILDSVDQGFLTALPSGKLLPERSKIIHTWLGELPEPCTIWDLVGRIDAAAVGWLQMAWLQVEDGVLPLDVAVDQLPKRLVRGEQHFALAYHPVETSGGELERIIIVLTDVTADVERQRALAEQHEFSVLVDLFVSDRHAFMDFWGEASRLTTHLLEAQAATSPDALRRDLHTLKGISRSCGLTRLSGLCHELEDSIQGRGEELPTAQELAALRAAWEALRTRMDPIIRGANAFVEISQEEYDALLATVKRRAPPAEVERLLKELRQEPAAWRLKRAANALEALARRLAKAPFDVVIEHDNLRLPSNRFASFWGVLPHVLNNAADHGIESNERRKGLGKPLPGRIRLATRLTAGEFVIEVEDDGAGIDWDRVRARAGELGLPHQSHADLLNALLSDGLSLKEGVSEVSGRGVGLSAVAAVVRSMNGRIELESQAGAGAKWTFRFAATKLESEAGRPGRETENPKPEEPKVGPKPDLTVG